MTASELTAAAASRSGTRRKPNIAAQAVRASTSCCARVRSGSGAMNGSRHTVIMLQPSSSADWPIWSRRISAIPVVAVLIASATSPTLSGT